MEEITPKRPELAANGGGGEKDSFGTGAWDWHWDWDWAKQKIKCQLTEAACVAAVSGCK